MFSDIWNHALQQCKADLNPADVKLIAELNDPSKLAEDLKRKESQADKPWLRRLYIEVAPVLAVLKQVTTFFLMSMQPLGIEVTIIWGLLYLIIEVLLLRSVPNTSIQFITKR